jgi:hypothetical protein
MSSIIYQIAIALQMTLGAGNYNQQANQIYVQGDYHVSNGVVIIDTDELFRAK